jgi:hypothetical protein
MRSWLVALMGIGMAGAARADGSHTVVSGETLTSIGKQVGCTVRELKKANELGNDDLDVGQELSIPDCDHAPRDKPVKVTTGQSLGKPWRGHLAHATELEAGKGYHIRRPWRAFGTSYTVGYIRRAIAEERRRFPKEHVLAVGDISQQKGGEISDHHSHQSGRDVDMGLFYKKQPEGYPDSFVTADESNLDCEKTLALIEAFAKTHDKPGGVQVIFLDFEVQGILYKWARAHGVDEDHLDFLFQFPHGRGTMDGLVRHEPNHADHFHVRFQCAPGDRGCE